MSPSDILTLATLAALLLPVYGHRDRHEGTTRQWSLSETVSFSSPEFLKLVPEMDEKMVPIDHAKVPDEVCLEMVEALANAHWKMKRPGIIHTGIILPEGAEIDPGWVDSVRKLRLLPLSFLATQSLENVKLYFWANVEGTHPLIQEIFGPLMGQYGKYIEIKKFDASAEIKKVCSHYESEKSTGELTAELVKTYESQSIVASKSDLMRAILLYNYGGAWMDSDVLLVQNLAPMLEEDWAVLMYADFVNPATLSVSRPDSPFITAWMGNILALGVNKSWAAYGPFMITDMTAEIQRSVANATFHVLPPCFFEGALSRDAHQPNQVAPLWDNFFSRLNRSLRSQVAYIDPSTKHSTFGYHWHNRWNQKIVDGSVAAEAEKMYCKRLNISLS